MSFVKGKSGNPKGCPEGAKGKAKVRIVVKDILDGLGFKPFEEAVKLIRSTKKERLKADMIMDLCSYIAPKLKHIELQGDEENPFLIHLNFDPNKKDMIVKEEIGNIIDGELEN